MSGVRLKEVRKKLLALTPFPQLEAVVALCRSEESAEKTDADLASVPALVNAASRSRHPQPSGPSSSRVTQRRPTAAASAGTAAHGPTRLASTSLHMGQRANRMASSTTLQRYARLVDIRGKDSRQASGTTSCQSIASALGSALE